MEISFEEIETKKVILSVGENKYAIPIKFDLAAALALENKCGSLENISKILNLETSLWIFAYMLNAGIERYNLNSAVKISKVEHIEKLIPSESLSDALIIRSVILKIVFDDFSTNEKESNTNNKKKESAIPEMT